LFFFVSESVHVRKDIKTCVCICTSLPQTNRTFYELKFTGCCDMMPYW